MEFKNPEKFWKSKAHRAIKGARGHRFLSLKAHLVVGVTALSMLQYVMRSEDTGVYRMPDPPCEAPPPSGTSLSYAITSELPYLKRFEVEPGIPSHIPQKKTFSAEQVREGKLSMRM